MSVEGDVARVLEETITFATASERLRGAVVGCRNLMQEIVELCEVDPELRPELHAAGEKLTECVDALKRAHTFADARLSARTRP